MVVAQSSAGVPPADRLRLEFVYDPPSHSFGVAGPQGRRRTKKVYEWQTDHWSLTTVHRYLYDGWNVICEQVTPASGQTSNRYYLWGLDIAEMQGAGLPAHSSPGATAGGVGGLLAAYTPDGNWFYCYDGQPRAQRARDGRTDPAIAGERAQRPKEAATSGNITTLVSTTDGAVSAPPAPIGARGPLLSGEVVRGLTPHGLQPLRPHPLPIRPGRRRQPLPLLHQAP